MKITILSLLLLGCALPAPAVQRSVLDSQIRLLGAKLEALQALPGKRIPEDILGRAQAVILLDATKSGGLTTYQGGGGVAMVRDPVGGMWSPVAFVGANAARLGLQVGNKQSFFVILLMTTNATRLLIDPAYEFGAETPANANAAAPGNAGAPGRQSILVYDDQQGFIGATGVQSGAFMADDDANRTYYGQVATLRAILFEKQVKPTGTTIDLANKIAGHGFLPHP